jgi:ElaB/YqjD/DUF883 family membrane-anchored ribosome-binding protein
MAERDQLTGSSSLSASAQAQERSVDEIRQDIASTRESITETVDQLSDRFQQTLDWRTYVKDYPLVAMGVALGLGFLVGGVLRPRSTPRQRMKEAFADSIEDLADRFRVQMDGIGWQRSRMGVSRTIKAAATGAITKAATDYLRARLTEREGGSNDPDDTSHSVRLDDRHVNTINRY